MEFEKTIHLLHFSNDIEMKTSTNTILLFMKTRFFILSVHEFTSFVPVKCARKTEKGKENHQSILLMFSVLVDRSHREDDFLWIYFVIIMRGILDLYINSIQKCSFSSHWWW